MDDEEGDHQGDYAGYTVGAEEEDYEERSEDGGGAAEGVAEPEGAHTDVGGEEFRDVDGEEQGDEDVDADDEEKTGERKQAGIADEGVDTAEEDGERGGADDGGLTADGVGGERADGCADGSADAHEEGVFEGTGDAEALLDEEGGEPGDEAVDESVGDDEDSCADEEAREELGAEERGKIAGGGCGRRGSGLGKRRLLAGEFAFDFLQHFFGFFGAADGFEPARGFGHRFAQVPDDECADAADDEHDAPAETGNEHGAGERADGEAGDDDGVEDPTPAAAGLRGKKLGHCGVTGYQFRAKADSHDTAEENESGHIGSEGGGDGREAEDDEVGLIGEAAAEAIAEEAGEERPEHHADEGDGDELGVLRESGEMAVERGAEDAGGDVDVVTVEEHADADQREYTAMKTGDREAVETRAGVDGQEWLTFSPQGRPWCRR